MPLNESVTRRLSKELFVSSTLHHCLVLLLSTFSEIFIDFDKFAHLRALINRNRHSSKKVLNSRNFTFTEDFN